MLNLSVEPEDAATISDSVNMFRRIQPNWFTEI